MKGITDSGWSVVVSFSFRFLVLDCGSNSDTNLANRAIQSSIRNAFELCDKDHQLGPAKWKLYQRLYNVWGILGLV